MLCMHNYSFPSQWQLDLEDLHDGLRIGFVWLRLPLAAWLQELADGRNPGHPALERLKGKQKMFFTGAFSNLCIVVNT